MQTITDLKFNALSQLNSQIITKIKLIYIFGINGTEVIIVTKDDTVFSFGSNKNGLLGLGHTSPIQEPTLVPELCNKQVIDISSGYDFVLALGKSGYLYSWGNNSFGQLGNGSQITAYNPIINITLIENNVTLVEISCGHFHSLLLTNKGEVYAFGRNSEGENGCGNSTNQLIPIKINQTFFNSEKVTSISCGGGHSLALTISGHVYSWGYNYSGQLGIGNNTNQNIPIIIESIINIMFKKIRGGLRHSILLSNDGYIYTFGRNTEGQIGNGNKVNQNIPLKLEKSVKFSDISTAIFSNISIGIAMNGNCYFWGECVNGVVMSPIETQFKSIHEIFFEFSKRKITYKPFVVEKELQENRILKKIGELFNNDKKYDLKLKIDNKFIYTQKYFLEMFCKSFTLFLPKNWSESNTNEIELKVYSYNVYYSFLKYIYTDCVDIDIEECVDLLDLANRLEEEELKCKCFQILKKSISEYNICLIYSAAVKYCSSDLEDFCLKFCSNKWNKIRRSDGFRQMDNNSRTKFIVRAGELKLF